MQTSREPVDTGVCFEDPLHFAGLEALHSAGEITQRAPRFQNCQLLAVAKSSGVQRSHFVEFDQFLHRVHPLRFSGEHDADQLPGSGSWLLPKGNDHETGGFRGPVGAVADHHLPKISNAEASVLSIKARQAPECTDPQIALKVLQYGIDGRSPLGWLQDPEKW